MVLIGLPPRLSTRCPKRLKKRGFLQCITRLQELFPLANGLFPSLELTRSLERKIAIEVNAEEEELDQELRLSEPLLRESEVPPEAEKTMMTEMNSMKELRCL